MGSSHLGRTAQNGREMEIYFCSNVHSTDPCHGIGTKYLFSISIFLGYGCANDSIHGCHLYDVGLGQIQTMVGFSWGHFS